MVTTAPTPPVANPPGQPTPGVPSLKAIANALKKILDTVFTGGISRVLTFDVDEQKNVKGKFHHEEQVYNYSIAPNGTTEYNEVEADSNSRSDSILLGYYVDSGWLKRHDRMESPGKRNCGKGKPCGNTCLERGDRCRINLSPLATQQLQGVRRAIEQVKPTRSGGASQAGQPATTAQSKPETTQEKAKPSAAKASGGGGAIAAGATAAIGAAAIGAGAIALANKKKEPPSAIESVLPQPQLTSSQKSILKAGAAIGATGAAYMGVSALDKKYQITDKAILSAATTAYAKSNEYEKIDEDIDRLPISPEFKQRVKNLTGAAKVYLAKTVLEKQGADVVSIDEKNNFSTFRRPNGSLVSVGSAGSNVISIASEFKGNAAGFPMYEMAFRINDSYDRKSNGRKEGVKLIRLAKASYQDHLKNLPENAFIKAKAHKGDDAGDKRQSIYEKEGFRTLNVRGDDL